MVIGFEGRFVVEGHEAVLVLVSVEGDVLSRGRCSRRGATKDKDDADEKPRKLAA